MSQEDVEIARSGFEAFNRAFSEGPPTSTRHSTRRSSGSRCRRSWRQRITGAHDEVRDWLEEMKRDWTSFEVRPEQFRDLGNGRVLALGSWRAQGRGSEVPLEFPQAAWLVQYRKGKLVRLQTFTERKQALEAAGLSE